MYIYLIQEFLIRFLTGPRFQPSAWFYALVIVKIFKPKGRYLPGPPKKSAQMDGFILSTISFILYMCNQTSAAFWVLSIFGILVANQMLFGICPGCMKWHLLSLTGFLPPKMAQESLMVFQVQRKKDRNAFAKLPSTDANSSEVTLPDTS
eukprot:TRINITY_DN523_c0_g1_i5.p1 TRINITY_DN523_c0_g1~~TRINITY_DN523_c0_g1_i5.p1  ORF type:complete len:150 (+),score=33.80 TRINITY_DN523_c0_g1_i5:110-559(+)